MIAKAQSKEPRPEYVSKAGLKVRGWTEKAVEKFLGVPDRTAKNPHYSKAAPMLLFLKKRVEVAETSEEYRCFVASNERRRAGAVRAVDAKKRALLAEVAAWEIVLHAGEYRRAVAAAIRSYNDFHEDMLAERGHEYTPASMDSDPEFLQRITVNYLRHEMSDYDDRLEELFGKVGKDEAYRVLNQKIYDAIARAYPELAVECQRQLGEKIADEAIGEPSLPSRYQL